MQTSPAESLVPLDAEIWSISGLNGEAKALLEDGFPSLWVTGEISNLARPGSGHIYLSLKDDRAEVRCAMFRGANRALKFRPENGDQVIVRARVTIYEPRGSYQLIVEHMEPAGEGLLRRQLEELKARLASEGLFAEDHKKPLPPLPRCVGIVTSPTGAAVRDILQVLGRRFAAVPVIVYPVQVQGERAKQQIADTLRIAADRAECDVLIVGRGGGSLEDLWAFNEEIVARAIHVCPIPVISAVGHEIDFTIADLVADVRAPTPSAAAEIVVPDAEEWLRAARAAEQRLGSALRRAIDTRRRHLEQLTGRIQRRHPGLILQQHAQRMDELTQRMGTSLEHRIDIERLRNANLIARLNNAAPVTRIDRFRERLTRAGMRAGSAMRKQLSDARSRLAVAAAGLQAVSPLQTLERGYAIIAETDTGKVITDASALKAEQRISGRLARGGFEAVVTKIDK